MVLPLSLVCSFPITQESKDLIYPEGRIKGHKRPRPCGRASPEGRKFFDWSVEFLDVNYNTVYNYNCGGGVQASAAPGGGPLGSHLQGGTLTSHLANHFQIGNRPQGGGSGVFGSVWSFLFGNSASAAASGSNSGVDIPVAQDPIVPDRFQRPGQYITVSNPVLGSYTQDISNINPNKVIKQANKEINKLLRPLYHIFKK